MTGIDYAAVLAPRYGVDVAALRALVAVESSGMGLMAGRPVIRLEVHHLWRNAAPDERSRVDARFRVRGPRAWDGHEFRDGGPAAPWAPLHQPKQAGQDREWRALDHARTINEAAAIAATSWGVGQVLGKYWIMLGYSSITAFAEGMNDLGQQYRAIVEYLAAAGGLSALKNHDWAEVALIYNGPGQQEWYAARLRAAHKKAQQEAT